LPHLGSIRSGGSDDVHSTVHFREVVNQEPSLIVLLEAETAHYRVRK